jgi:glyoxylase-like metal-dependent hydrolase (beta-lactamase superfamily II)
MNQLRYMYSKGLGVFLFLFLAFTQHVIAQTKVFHLQNYFTEAYLIKGNGDQLILVDTGVPLEGYQDTLLKSIRDLGFKPENITLAIVTHGHGDHAGNA